MTHVLVKVNKQQNTNSEAHFSESILQLKTSAVHRCSSEGRACLGSYIGALLLLCKVNEEGCARMIFERKIVFSDALVIRASKVRRRKKHCNSRLVHERINQETFENCKHRNVKLKQ